MYMLQSKLKNRLKIARMGNQTYNYTSYKNLLEYRSLVADMYKKLLEFDDKNLAHTFFIESKTELYRTHPCTPLEKPEKLETLHFYEYDDSFNVLGEVEEKEPVFHQIDLPEDGIVKLVEYGDILFSIQNKKLSLPIYWIDLYGGGIFIPFKDKTSAYETYGGGRYLWDTLKGANLGFTKNQINLDFNFAYNPSCAYSSKWNCPLAFGDSVIDFAILAGEQVFWDSTSSS